MDNQPNQEIPGQERLHTQHHGAHSGSRSGLSDYHDGGNLSHYGGNDDYKFSDFDESDFDQNIALGNDGEFDDDKADDDQDHGKYHSGL